MKGFHFMMGMILFNMSVGLFDIFGIWRMEYSSYDVTNIFSLSLVLVFLGGVSIATAAGILFPHAEKNVVYGLLTLTFMPLWLNTTVIFSSFGFQIDKITGTSNGTILIGGFLAVGIFMFLIGIIQMSTGGWATYE